MNTRINYLYRDAANYKAHNECVIEGELTPEQQAVILDCLDGGEYFIPRQVGLPERRFDTYDPVADHPWMELRADGFVCTEQEATVALTAEALVKKFLHCKNNWLV